MKRHLSQLRPLVLAAGLGALFAAPAFADPMCDHMRPGGRHDHQAKHLERHHKQLHDALKLSPEQEGGWQKLLDSEPHREPVDAAPRADWGGLTTPERAEKMLEFGKLRQEKMAEHLVALKAFYGSLTPEQRKVFDDAHSGPRRGMRGEGRPGSGPMVKP